MSEILMEVPIEETFVSPWNPRRYCDEQKLGELMEAIKAVGAIMQPPVARLAPAEDEGAPQRYEIIFGSRRREAARRLGYQTMKVIVRVLTDEDLAIMALQENIQREEAAPLDEGLAFERCMESFGWDVRGLAARLGKKKTYVYRRLRLARRVESPALQELINRGGMWCRDWVEVSGWDERLQATLLERLEAAPEYVAWCKGEAAPEVLAPVVRARVQALTPRVEARRWYEAAAEEVRLPAGEVLGEEGLIRPGGGWVALDEPVDETILRTDKLPARAPARVTWRWVVGQLGEMGLPVRRVEPVPPRYRRLEVVERTLVLAAARAGGLGFFRARDVSVDRAEGIAAEREAHRWEVWSRELCLRVAALDLSAPEASPDLVRLAVTLLDPAPRRAVERVVVEAGFPSVMHVLAAVMLLEGCTAMRLEGAGAQWLRVYEEGRAGL